MNISLTPQLEALVKQKVEAGLYSSPDELFAAALRLLDERDKKLAALRKDIQDGLASPSRPFDDAAVDRIKARGRERLAQERRNSL